MCRDYYLHKRRSGIYYVEFVDKSTGKPQKPRPIAEVAGIENIVRAIRKSDLNSDDALWIVSTLKSMGLIDILVVKNSGAGAIPFVDFLKTFWDYDKSV